MSRSALGFVFALACSLHLVPIAHADGTRDQAFEQRLDATLRARSPEAADLFRRATADLDASRYAEARAEFTRVRALAPGFSAATRRLGAVRFKEDAVDEAITLARTAITEEPDAPENRGVLVQFLVDRKHAGDVDAARAELETLVASHPDAAETAETQLTFALATGDANGVELALGRVERLSTPATIARAYAAAAEHSLRAHDLARARQYLELGSAIDPDSNAVYRMRGFVALEGNDVAALREVQRDLGRVAPNDPFRHFFHAVLLANDGELGAARDAIEAARAAGLPPPMVASFVQSLDEATPWWERVMRPVGYALGAWLAGMALLFALGMLLSRLTLRAVRDLPLHVDGGGTLVSERLRSAYRAVLGLSCAYYYLSMPIVALVVIAATLGIIGFFFFIGHIPIKLVLIVGFVGVVTIYHLVRSLFVRPVETDPGEKLQLARYPQLRAVLDDVAGVVGTRPVDTVYLEPGAGIAVFEKGGMREQLRGRSERCLVLGLAALDGMRLGELKSILAHEYGHFRNADSAGGGLALAVRRSLFTMADGLARGGGASRLNPAWLFLEGFLHAFLRISHGASRLQEVLADQWAAHAYGSAAFERGLTHVIAAEVRFHATTSALVREAVQQKVPLRSFYRQVPGTPVPETEIEAEIAKSMTREPSAYDSHPTPAARFERVRRIDAAGERLGEADETTLATELLPDREKLEARMTDTMCANIAASGLVVPRSRSEGGVFAQSA